MAKVVDSTKVTRLVVLNVCRCGHEWQKRKKGRPVVCPKCKDYSWDKR